MSEYNETIEYKRKTITLSYDDHPESPREWDNLGTMLCIHHHYVLGDQTKVTVEEIKEILDRKDIVVLPLYLYDHSGITMSCKPFSCPWDSGQVGIIYVEYEKIKKEYNIKKVGAKLREKVRKILISEVETYDAYLRGDIWVWDAEGDCVGGYYRQEDAIEDAKNHINYVLAERTKKHVEKLKAQIQHGVPLEHRESLAV